MIVERSSILICLRLPKGSPEISVFLSLLNYSEVAGSMLVLLEEADVFECSFFVAFFISRDYLTSLP